MSVILLTQGTAKSWKTTGGTGVITLTSLASAAARQGDKLDLGATFAEVWSYRLLSKFAVAPSDATLLRLCLAFSDDNTNFPGGASGSDGAYSDLQDLRNLVELTPLVADADTNAHSVVSSFRALARYVAPVVYNDATGQALSGTAGDHELVIWPLQGDIA